MEQRAPRVRENPAKKRERVAKIAREMSLAQIKLSPEDRRGLLFGRIVAAGIKALRPNQTEDVSGTVLEIAAAAALRAMAEDGIIAEAGQLKEKVHQLEAKLAETGHQFSARDISYMKTLRTYGMTYAQVAQTFHTDEATIRKALGVKGGGRRKAAALPKPDEGNRIAGLAPDGADATATETPKAAGKG
ncbi:hypothetical protein [Azospirillum argentinense]|uniref:hypothetical protein n=1 Tax=Azospirillum argentinense TaxID=2970906 RepID=UPI0032DEB078